MKKLMLVCVLALTSISASALSCKSGDSQCHDAQAVIDVINSDKTPADAKELLISVLSPDGSVVAQILRNEVVDAAAGLAFRTIHVGIDNPHDDDDGWSTVYEISVETQRNADGKDVIVSVTLTGIAG